MGLGICVVGLNGLVSIMLYVENNSIKSRFELLLIISLSIGCVIGEYLDIDGQLNRFGKYIENKLNYQGIAKGFISASLIYCIGAMAIIGAINDGLSNNPNLLIVKSLLDGIISIILSASLGVGVLFSFISVGIYQGFITFMAAYAGSFISNGLIDHVCLTGYALVITVGIDLLFNKNIKTANLLPSLLVTVIWYFIQNI